MKEQQVRSIDELNLFIYTYYDTHKGIVFKVVSKFFDVIVFGIGNESKEDFISKVNGFYKQLENKPTHWKRPLLLSYEITEEFNIKTLFRRNV